MVRGFSLGRYLTTMWIDTDLQTLEGFEAKDCLDQVKGSYLSS